MRAFVCLIAGIGFCTLAITQEPAPVLTPAEAAEKIHEKVVVEFEVKSARQAEAGFLNSAADFKDAKNFTVFIPTSALKRFKEAQIDDVATHFRGKTIRVAGTVMLFKDKPQIKIEDPEQIEIVAKP
ncbi:MAG: hypothetical protein SFU86_02085 [Pirellulaceae bacterium]|nr:hypothetical protein [Pirellulaceae bacterium]